MGYPEKSFETALSILRMDKGSCGVSTGWDMATLQPVGGTSNLDLSKVRNQVKEVLLFGLVNIKLSELVGQSVLGPFGPGFSMGGLPVVGTGSALLPTDMEGTKLMAKCQMLRILQDYKGNERDRFEQRARTAGFGHIKLFESLAEPFGVPNEQLAMLNDLPKESWILGKGPTLPLPSASIFGRSFRNHQSFPW